MKKLLSWLLILAMLMMGGVALAQGAVGQTENTAAATEEEDDGWFDVAPILLPLMAGEGMDVNMIMNNTESRAMFTVIAAFELSMCETFAYDVDFLAPTYIGSADGLFIVMYFEAEPVVPETAVPAASAAPAENVGVVVFYSPLTGTMEYTITANAGKLQIENVMESVCPGTWYENGVLDIYNALNDLLEIMS